MKNNGYYAVKLDAGRNVVDRLPGTFTASKDCLNAARIAFGKAGGLQFVASKATLQ